MTLTQKYEQVNKLPKYLASKFKERFGGDYQELLSEANEHTVHAILTHQDSLGTLSARVQHQIWYGLLQTLEKQIRREGISKTELWEDPSEILDRNHFDLPLFLREISEEAREVIGLLLELPEIEAELPDKLRYKGRTGMIRDALTSTLKGLGWTAEQIRESFREIREALS